MCLKLSFYDTKGRMVHDTPLLPVTRQIADGIITKKTFNNKLKAYLKYAKQFKNECNVDLEMDLIMKKWNDGDYTPIFYIA